MSTAERSLSKIAAIIPARMGSSRYPGKPLIQFQGLPMIEHVRRRTMLCKEFNRVLVATCDQAIARAVEAYGGEVVMTSDKHEAASDRVAEAMQKTGCTHVVNVQGDEILVLPQDLSAMARAIAENPHVPAWNAVASIESAEELKDSSIVKGLLGVSGQILFCARDFSYLPLQAPRYEPAIKILGLLAYSREFLERYPTLSRTPIERALSVDQMRIIEHGIELRSVEFKRGYPGINEPREVELVEKFMKEDPAQREILEKILKN